ncbi:hypothetical protein AAC387_Pa01g2065 [Persea americana]
MKKSYATIPSASGADMIQNGLYGALSQNPDKKGLSVPVLRTAVKDICMVELSEGLNQDAGNLSKLLKATFGISWKEVLCEGQVLEGKISAGSPAVLIISTSALRSLELLSFKRNDSLYRLLWNVSAKTQLKSC